MLLEYRDLVRETIDDISDQATLRTFLGTQVCSSQKSQSGAPLILKSRNPKIPVRRPPHPEIQKSKIPVRRPPHPEIQKSKNPSQTPPSS